MLSIDTGYVDSREMQEEPDDKLIAKHDNILTSMSQISKIQLKTPKYGMHPYQHPTDLHKRKQQQPVRSRACSTPTSSITSQEYSGHTKSGNSKNSRSIKSGNDNTGNGIGIVVSSFSNLATQSIEEGQYNQALEYYQLAFQDYMKDASKTTVVELVNAAATCFNLGALAKKLRDYTQAAKYFAEAQDIYRQSGTLIETHVRSGNGTFPLSPSATSSISSASVSTYACQVCLLQLVVETLQARAHLHYKYQSLLDDAVECHQEVVELLEKTNANNDNEAHGEFKPSSLEPDIVYHKIHFTSLPRCLRWQLMVTSLQALGKLYVEKGKLEDAIIAYQDTLSTLRRLNDFQGESTLQRQEEILQILGALSDFYMQNYLESTDVVKLERAAILQEDLEHWEKAMQCWERVLYCQSKEYGDDSFEVSITLGQLARVMVLEGNLEGALDLYQATANISLRNAQDHGRNTSEKPISKDSIVFSIPEGIFSGILDVFHALDRLLDAIDWLKSLLSRSERREDQARIQLELGKLYLEQGFVHDASNALYLSLELFDGEDESAFELLQQVEFLGERSDKESFVVEKGGKPEHIHKIDAPDKGFVAERSAGVDRLTAITEDGESAFLTEGTSAPASSHGAGFSDGFNELVRDDDYDSEDLSKLMTNFDEVNDLQHSNAKGIDSPSKTTKAPVDTNHTTNEFMEEKKEEELSRQLFPSDSVAKNAINIEQRENKLISARDSDSSIGGSPPQTTKSSNTQLREKPESFSRLVNIPNLSSDCSSTSKRTELICVETRNSENNSKHQAIISKSSQSNATNSGIEEADNIQDLTDQECPIVSQSERSGINGALSPLTATNSGAALPRSAEKTGATPASLSFSKTTQSPNLAIDETSSRGRKVVTEIKTPGKNLGGNGRRRIVKALSSPFRRSRSKTRSSNSNILVPLDEEKEIRQSMPTKKSHKDLNEDELIPSKEAPILYIDVRGNSDDEMSLVSQLTFREYEMLSKKKERQNENGHWWWGVTSEGLEGWFPSDYVNQAVEAAEGFLSAKSIHDRVKSRPLDFDSDEESEEVNEDISRLKEKLPQPSKTLGTTTDTAKDKSSKPLDLSEQSRMQSFGSSAKEVDESNSGSKNTNTLESLIKVKEIELEAMRNQNGPDDISVAGLLFDLAQLHLRRKDSTIAMLYSRQAMKIQKSTLNLPEACNSLNFMAEVHSREKRYKDALLCFSEVQRIHEALYGYFHEEIAIDLNHCGHILARQGKFDLAMDKHKEALRILKDCCGENVKNPLVSETLIQIGAVYYKERNSLATIQSKQNDGYKTFIEGGMLEVIGRAHEDRGSYRMAIAFFEEKLQFLNDGESSSHLEDVAETLNSLGMLSCRAGMYLEAIDYYDRALGIQMKLGCDDVQLAMARVLAGSVQYSLGHFSKALKLFQDALGTLRQVGLEQETVAATLFHIGAVHAALCNYDDAMLNLRDAFDIQSKLLGTEHPATFRTRREIGNLYAIYESEVDAAFDEYNDIIEAQKRVHGDKHPYVAETLHSIGCVKARKGDLSGALKSLEDCYNMRLNSLGMDHPQQATTLHEIAKIQLKRGRLKKAIHIIDAALKIRVESLSEQHIDVALAMATKASCFVARVNFADANKLFMEALPIAKAAVGDFHPSVGWIQVQIGIMHLRKCDFEKASSSVKKAIAIYRQSKLDDDHPGIKEATEELERIERSEMLCV